MASPAYMWLTDSQKQPIMGGTRVVGRDGSIEILEFDHQIRMPTDSDTGALTGTRKHEALRFTKEMDNSSPYLYKACCEGQTLRQVKVSWYRINEDGREVEYFRHQLEGVKVTSVRPRMFNIKDSAKERYPHLEEIQFRYAKITWTFIDGNITASDAWNENRS